jgi:hypothetical protein
MTAPAPTPERAKAVRRRCWIVGSGAFVTSITVGWLTDPFAAVVGVACGGLVAVAIVAHDETYRNEDLP